MDAVITTQLGVPAMQIALLLLLSTVALLFGRIKLALLINYLFTLHWGYIVNRETLIGDQVGSMSFFTPVYFGFGLVVVVFALTGFLVHRD